jgi:hypothetical protein
MTTAVQRQIRVTPTHNGTYAPPRSATPGRAAAVAATGLGTATGGGVDASTRGGQTVRMARRVHARRNHRYPSVLRVHLRTACPQS